MAMAMAMAMANPLSLDLINGGAMQLSASKECKYSPLESGQLRSRIHERSRARVSTTSGGAAAMANSLSLSALRGCKCRALELGQLRLRGGAGVRGRSSLNGGVVGGGSDHDAAMWLREKLPLQLERDGVAIDASRRIAEACADACTRFLATGRPFDPMMIMDAMEEEIERRDLRGDEFLPFELGRRAAKVLTERWNELPVTERPKAYRQQAYVNKKDVVDFDKWPENLKLP